MAFDPEIVRAWVVRTRTAQGLPPVLNDPVIIAKIVEILEAHRRAQAARAESIRSAARSRVTSR